ncbi:MAG TPA: RNA 2'-phosphotransferase [Pyrinomonadaceae bacterium]|nr:RNA 2'-phosphotransferase [Pyrinomonadaceae bacterium]
MDNERLIKISKYLSKHLRHQPERLGLELAPGGWVEVDRLLGSCAAHNVLITRAELEEVVARNDKQRFSFDETGRRIRANQGHSVEVDLQLQASSPPPVLYHGTGERAVKLIEAAGLRKMGRHHVHLSQDVETARKVGARRGRPVVFAVDAVGMSEAGHEFYVTANGVWLVDGVPPRYLRIL